MKYDDKKVMGYAEILDILGKTKTTENKPRADAFFCYYNLKKSFENLPKEVREAVVSNLKLEHDGLTRVGK